MDDDNQPLPTPVSERKKQVRLSIIAYLCQFANITSPDLRVSQLGLRSVSERSEHMLAHTQSYSNMQSQFVRLSLHHPFA